jgi:hypothetical protein
VGFVINPKKKLIPRDEQKGMRNVVDLIRFDVPTIGFFELGTKFLPIQALGCSCCSQRFGLEGTPSSTQESRPLARRNLLNQPPFQYLSAHPLG